jgi:protein-L-isoaspartate(D-aspartate) O-methyltransferase
VVTASAEEIPKPLIEQLKEGGAMVIPIGSVESVQSLTLVKKKENDVVTVNLLPVRFVPLIHSR